MSNVSPTLTSRRAWFAAGIPILALVMVSMALALALLWGFAREQDTAFEDTSTRLVENAWASRENASARVALDYAVWNDAYLATTVRWNAEWVDNNYYSSIADAIFVVRADGVVRHAWLADALQPQAHAIQTGVVEAVEHDFNLLALLSAPRKEDMTATTMFVSNGEAVLVSIAPISPEEQTVRQERDPDLPVDYLVAVDLVTAVELAEIGASLQTSGLRFASSRPAGGDPVHIQRAMAAASGEIVGALSWDRQRPGSDAFLGNVGLIVAVLLLVGALAILLARRLVSDQLRAAAEVSVAVEASRVKSDFISTMSHELRTPLNAIMGYTELIKESLEDGASPEALNAEADRVLGAAKHLSRLINDVLDQSRIDAGKLQVSLENVEIAGVLSELEELVAPLAQANGNRLSVSADEGVRFVTADPMRLQQCLINLTGNALKFTHAGEVKVHARLLLDHAHAYVSFDVSDTGIGMDKNELERLFKPFAQANKKVSAKYGGTGLGLSITKNLARAMGGDVTAESALGKGSTFRLRLRAGEAVARTGPRLVHAA